MRAAALGHINDGYYVHKQKYNLIGLNDPAAEVRQAAVDSLRLDLYKLTPILLKVMTSDSDPEVRLKAAIKLQCQFTCGRSDSEPQVEIKDIRSLERDLLLLEKAIRNETAGRYVVETLDEEWCDLTENTRKYLTPMLTSRLPDGKDTVSIDWVAKQLLKHHPSNSCH